MSRVYTNEPSPRLARIDCDGCGASITPNPKIAESGWTVRGVAGTGATTEHCPDCAVGVAIQRFPGSGVKA